MHETVGTQIKKSEKISDNHLMPFDFRFFLCPNCGMCVLLASVVGSGGGSTPSSIPHNVGSSTNGVKVSIFWGGQVVSPVAFHHRYTTTTTTTTSTTTTVCCFFFFFFTPIPIYGVLL